MSSHHGDQAVLLTASLAACDFGVGDHRWRAMGRLTDAGPGCRTRSLQVIQLLRGGPRRAGELAKASGTSAPTMSRHLRVLLRAGIVGDDRPSDDARARVFWLRPEAIGAVRAWLDQLQVAGDEQLAAFKKHVERRDAT